MKAVIFAKDRSHTSRYRDNASPEKLVLKDCTVVAPDYLYI